MGDKMRRREFFKTLGFVGLAAYGSKGVFVDIAEAAGMPTIAVASKGSPEELLQKAVGAFGGMKKFVKKGAVVVLKPNSAFMRKPHQAANTNPELVAAAVKLCKEAGAKKVIVLDHTIDKPPEMVFQTNGIQQAAEKAGATVIYANDKGMYQRIKVPKGRLLKSEDVVEEVLKADVFINMPIAKDHSATRLSLGMKNLMGIIWNRQAWHSSPDHHQCIADFSTAIKPDLIIMDAIRILLTNGPKGPGKTKDVNKVIVGTDPVAVDAYTASLFGIKPEQVQYIAYAYKLGLGEIDLKKVKIKNV